jgi:predicted nucleotidyltransferase
MTARTTAGLKLDLPMDAIADFCRRWKVREFAVFESILRDDFGDDSDVDVMVSFADDVAHGLFAFARMQDELAALLGRPVDLSTRAGIEEGVNANRRRDILSSARTIYAA